VENIKVKRDALFVAKSILILIPMAIALRALRTHGARNMILM